MIGPGSATASAIPDLLGWARAQRGDLIWAALTLWRAWLAAGAPEGQVRLGMFERWSAVLGGLLATAGVPGFLGNREELYDKADEEGRVWRRIGVGSGWDQHGSKPVGVADLWSIVQDADIDLRLGDGTERSQRTRLGKRIGTMRDRHFGDHRIEDAGTSRGSQRWRLWRGRGGRCTQTFSPEYTHASQEPLTRGCWKTSSTSTTSASVYLARDSHARGPGE